MAVVVNTLRQLHAVEVVDGTRERAFPLVVTPEVLVGVPAFHKRSDNPLGLAIGLWDIRACETLFNPSFTARTHGVVLIVFPSYETYECNGCKPGLFRCLSVSLVCLCTTLEVASFRS